MEGGCTKGINYVMAPMKLKVYKIVPSPLKSATHSYLLRLIIIVLVSRGEKEKKQIRLIAYSNYNPRTTRLVPVAIASWTDRRATPPSAFACACTRRTTPPAGQSAQSTGSLPQQLRQSQRRSAKCPSHRASRSSGYSPHRTR